jgi:hypothetical protein
MYVSSRDSPQSLEFWEDGRQSGTNHIAEESTLHDEVPGKRHNETLQARWLDPVWLQAKLGRGRRGWALPYSDRMVSYESGKRLIPV